MFEETTSRRGGQKREEVSVCSPNREQRTWWSVGERRTTGDDDQTLTDLIPLYFPREFIIRLFQICSTITIKGKEAEQYAKESRADTR